MIEYFIPAALKFSFFKHLSKLVLTVILVSCNGTDGFAQRIQIGAKMKFTD
ncbi:hypothetical protein [Eudoraea sp.]|uniref:hypothetical protein n=1 Tax=Eudoraea sp. TaxID=1979955 RepID=UPI003C71D185